MKRILFLLTAVCALLPVLTPASASPWQDAFDKGNGLYAREDYPQALEAYETALQSGYESWELFFNMGNAHYRTGNYPLAILYYERAARLNPKEQDIQDNLHLAESKIADHFEDMPEFFATACWLGFIKTFSASGWAMAVFLFFFLSLASVFLYLSSHTYGRKRAGFYSMLVSSALCILCLCAAAGVHNEMQKEFAIVMDTSVEAKTSPEERSETKFVLHEGSKVLIEDHIAPYYKVRIKNGSRAWVPVDCLERI